VIHTHVVEGLDSTVQLYFICYFFYKHVCKHKVFFFYLGFTYIYRKKTLFVIFFKKKMCPHECICTLTRVCMYMYMHTHTQTHIYTYTYICTYTYTCIHAHTYTHTCTCTCTHRQNISATTPQHVKQYHRRTHASIYICMHIHIYMHIHICAQPAANVSQMCTLMSKEHLYNAYSCTCTSAQNTCSNVHSTLTAKKMHIYICIHT